MAKTKTFDDIKNPQVLMTPNWKRLNDATGEVEYKQWRVQITGVGTDDAGAKEPGSETHYYGTWRTTPYTIKECWTYLKAATTLNDVICGDLKDFYENMIDEDIS